VDFVIKNEGVLEDTGKLVEKLWHTKKDSKRDEQGVDVMKSNLFYSLKEADRVEIHNVIDNYVDLLLPNEENVIRPPLAKDGVIPSDTLLAEHGLCLLIRVFKGGEKHDILLDAGYSRLGVIHNMEQLGLDFENIEAIVLSHGHMDHTGSLYDIIDRMTKKTRLVFHPDAFLSRRYLVPEDGQKMLFPQKLDRAELEDRDVEMLEKKTATTIADNLVLVTGEVERITSFEKGLPNAFLERNGMLEKDIILDDQSLVIRLKEKGLVVISGCSHSGIINTLLFAEKLTGVKQIHAVIGGFHLTGAFFELIIEETIQELKKMNPEVLVPMHCTGWKAIKRFSEEFPASFILNSVGSKVTLS